MNPLIRASVLRMHGYVPGEQFNDPDIVKLNTNENPYPAGPAVAGAVARAAADLRKYPDPLCTALRREAAARFGGGPENYFFGNGSDEILALCTRAFVDPGQAVGCFDPSYSLYPVLADIAGVRCLPVPLAEDFTWTEPDLPNDCRVFFLANPNAPTSLAFPPERIRAFCQKFPGVVVVDEAYADFAGVTCAALALELPNVLVCRTFSKSYSMAGARLGFAIAPAALIAAFDTIKDSYNVNGLTQAAGLAALRDEVTFRVNMGKVLATRARVAAVLKQRGCEVPESASNFLFIRKPGWDAKAVFQHLRSRRVFVRHFDLPRIRDRLRVTIGTDAEMDRFLAELP
jgi:histidinol-phosphate aminotransferase